MSPGLEFGVNQLAIHAHFETAPIRGQERQGFNFWFELFQQFACQAHGPVSVMSDCAIDNLYFEHILLLKINCANYNMPDLTPGRNPDRLRFRSGYHFSLHPVKRAGIRLIILPLSLVVAGSLWYNSRA